ncbi:MAG: hypothetical protein CM1200mP5_3400 [Candidatus Pelagibacterales bacterium]|nr:MAG: hypothetical protein CM1200mP5_3400 [Pelagibacterales bacterium]
MSHYDTNLDKNNANFVPLTPLSFLQEQKIFIQIMKHNLEEGNIHGGGLKRCVKFASALKKIGIGKGDTVRS